MATEEMLTDFNETEKYKRKVSNTEEDQLGMINYTFTKVLGL